MATEPRGCPCEAVLVPAQMASAVEGYSWARNVVGESGGAVYRLHGKPGIADRYQDLAILWNGLGEFGAPLQGRLFEQYGAACVDHGRLEFHLMLDEFF